MCAESSGVALGESLGVEGSVKLEDFYEAEVIMILGQNPGTNHSAHASRLCRRPKLTGQLIISINPLPEAGLMGFNNPQQLKGLLNIGDATHGCLPTGEDQW